jgi:hypothetical protein
MRRTFSDLIDDVSFMIGDSFTRIPRAEILESLIDGYARLCVGADTPRTMEAQDIPPRFQAGITHDWERSYVNGTAYKFTFRVGDFEALTIGAIQALGGATTIASNTTVSQLWMLSKIDSVTDLPYRISIPRESAHLVGLFYDNRILLPVTRRNLAGERDYQNIQGRPSFYTVDADGQSFDIYRIVTADNAVYETDEPRGIARTFSGDRSYTTDTDGSLSHGIVRHISSPDRDYHNVVSWRTNGTARAFASSDDNALIYATAIPSRALTEQDDLSMIPEQLEKYVRYYAQFQIFNRPGEVYEPNMAEHWRQRFERGVSHLEKIKNLAFRDYQYSRASDRIVSRLQAPRLPDGYPSLRR